MTNSVEQKWQLTRQNILDSTGYPKELWEMVEKFAEKILSKGRPNFDVPHTHGAVNWAYKLSSELNKQVAAKEISEGEFVDLMVIITAAWLHDIGYYGQFEGVADYAQVDNKKAMHMIVGAKMAKDFLQKYASLFMSSTQIDLVAHLIEVHDDLDRITTILETLLVEADTLGMLDVTWVEPTYKGEEALNFPNMEKTQKRFSLFKTQLGKASLSEIVEKFKQFVINRDFVEKT